MPDKSAIVLLHSKTLEYFTNGQAPGLKLEIPSEIISNQELQVGAAEKLRTLLADFFTTQKIAPTSVKILITADLIYQKVLPKLAAEEKSKQIEHFIDNLPFSKEVIQSVAYEKADGLVVAAVNREIYQLFVDAFEQAKFKVTLVLPAAISGVEDAVKIISRKDFVSQLNLLKKPKHQFVHFKPLLIVSVILVIILIIIFGLTFVFKDRFFNSISGSPAAGQKTDTTMPSPTAELSAAPTEEIAATESATSASSSASAAEAKKAKTALQILVLNGTGKAGEAGRVSLIFEDLGYQKAKTGNFSSADSTQTTVFFSDATDQKERTEFLTQLEIQFSNVTSSSNRADFSGPSMSAAASSAATTADVIIVTGE